jgi:4-carboxymuconolactone decarboxylase
MTISEQARKNQNELFPGHTSQLAVTDPELIQVFDHFAFDEVLQQGNLDPRIRLMVQLAAMIACLALREYRVMLGAALIVGVTPIEAKEIVYQAVPYVGMAKVYDFLYATNEVLSERGIHLPLPGQSTTTPELASTRAARFKDRLLVRIEWISFMPPPRKIRCIFSAIYRPTLWRSRCARRHRYSYTRVAYAEHAGFARRM